MCGINDWTIVPAHYTGLMQFWFGKGTGTKCDDFFTADLCRQCHSKADQPENRKCLEASFDFMRAIARSLFVDYKTGHIVFEGEFPITTELLQKLTVQDHDKLFDLLMQLKNHHLDWSLVLK